MTLKMTVMARATGVSAGISPKPMVDTVSKLNQSPSPKVRVVGSDSQTAVEQSRKKTRNTPVMWAKPA